jgi:tetratricopeptide (TPR) repeat protein
VVTDVGEKRGIAIARGCEQMRSAFLQLMNRASADDPAPLLIFAVDGEKEVDGLAGVGPKSRHRGLFMPAADESFILIDASGDPAPIAFHEYAHELLNANTSFKVQTWFEEGFAEYFSSFDATARKANVGRVQVEKLRFLRQNGKLMRFADLVHADQNSVIYRQNGPAQEMFYVESWLLVHYLFDHGAIGRAEPLFSLMAAGMPLDEAVEQAFGMKTEKLERELLEYAQGQRFRFFSLPLANDASEERITTRFLSDVSAAALQAEVRWHNAEHSKKGAAGFAAEYRMLLLQEPQNAIALRGLGLALLAMGDYQGAFIALRDAVRIQPEDVLNHHALATLLTAALESGQANNSQLTAQSEAEVCAKLDPNFADAYALIASALVQKGEGDRAESVLRRAIQLSPRSEAYQLQFAEIQFRNRDYAPALALLQQLKNSHDPAVAKRAETFLAASARKP